MGYIEELRSLIGHKPVILNGVSVLIIDKNNSILLQKRISPQKLWGLPGGLMELGESLEETGKREVFEETGLKIDNLKFLKIFSGKEFHLKLPNKDEFYLVNAVYYTYDFQGKLILNENEGSALEFFSINDLPKDMVKSHRLFIETYIADILN
ncbi:NUDIX hydrolase [Clostridium senegalense]|uniref:NUDIX hydrolase n=1 Tax=Clostridium senegalense TaxID=1465809 RepID=UPI001C12079C|nr:NUDIX hydrolase [Clostridium senegalense]MBU5227909.1 NUDIX hydrolase [Clostridium senegalense]